MESSQQLPNHLLEKFFNHSSAPVDQIQHKDQYDQNVQITKALKNSPKIG